jgi:2-polyprenyl-3-methyl-5-hydroxy-6-metoxy-1,4-benzoquinol methylase
MTCIEKCICGSVNYRHLMKHKIFIKQGEIVQCNECEFIWSKQQLNDIELEVFYKEKYRDLKGEVLNFTRFRNDLQRAISQYNFYGSSLNLDLSQEVLEIGAGWGVSPRYLHKQGFDKIHIIEPDARVDHILSKGIRKLSSVAKAPDNFFSLVVMSHVLEHIFNVQNFLHELIVKIKKSSIVFVEVPNCENPQVLLQSSESYHYWFFTKKTLIDLFKSQGFDPVQVETYGKDKFSKNKAALKHSNIICKYESSDDEAYWIRGIFKVR